MFTGSAINNSMVYLIPLFNSVQAMTSIFSFDANIINITITIASNIIYSGLLVLVLTRMFNSEKVMFNK
jgi:sodium transport system permease protein